jgi:hypothetical protein
MGKAMNQIASGTAQELPILRMPWGWMLVVVATFGAVLCAFWIAHAHHRVVSGVCVEWDVDAKRALAPLLHEAKVLDRRLLDALTALRRARHSCTAGRLDLARRDYEAVRVLYELPVSAIAHN